MNYKKAKIVCLCNGVTEKEILKILKLGARDLEEVRQFTLASTGCGKCKGEIKTIMEQYFLDKTPDYQGRINFENPL
jgi:NAD(P)H-nitrite reductase large subunit